MIVDLEELKEIGGIYRWEVVARGTRDGLHVPQQAVIVTLMHHINARAC
jgi:hypothetical protein